jgi:hypothetical protein
MILIDVCREYENISPPLSYRSFPLRSIVILFLTITSAAIMEASFPAR